MRGVKLSWVCFDINEKFDFVAVEVLSLIVFKTRRWTLLSKHNEDFASSAGLEEHITCREVHSLLQDNVETIVGFQ